MALSTTVTRTQRGETELLSPYITATGNDTTDPANGSVIDNLDGRILSLSVAANVTASSGTSPTLNLILQGSVDGSNWFTVFSYQGTPAAVQTGATSISSATTFGFHTAQFGLSNGGLPPKLRVQGDLGGTTPGWTGTIAVHAVRRKTN